MTCNAKPSRARLLRQGLPALLLAALALLMTMRISHAQEPAPVVEPAAVPAAITGTTVDRDIDQDTTWTKAGSPYTVVTNVTVRAGAKLTIQPGVTVIVNNPQGFAIPLAVQGTLIAQGSAAEPILFTGGTKTPGSWGGLIVGNSEQQPAQITLDYVTIEYGVMVGLTNRGNLELQAAVANIDHSTFRFGGSHGLSASYATDLTLRNSSFVGNERSAVFFSSGLAPDPIFSNLTASGNKEYDAVLYDSVDIDKPHRLEKMGLPYIFYASSVESTGELIVDPGVEIRVVTGFYIHGSIKALGTPAEPILITGVNKTTTFTYNNLNQLTDHTGYNLTGTTDPGYYSASGSKEYQFDINGNMTWRRFGDGTKWDYTWNIDNRLTNVHRTAGSITGGSSYDISFAYDSAGRRILRKGVGASDGLRQRTRYFGRRFSRRSADDPARCRLCSR